MKPKVHAILKKKYEEEFVQVGNDLARNNKLTYAARGMLVHLLSLPEDWVIHQETFVIEKLVGIAAVRTIFKELQNHNYLHYITLSDGKGILLKYWCVSYNPQTKEYWVERLSKTKNLLNLENLRLRESEAINKDLKTKIDKSTKKEEEQKQRSSSSCPSFQTKIREEFWKQYRGYMEKPHMSLHVRTKQKLEEATLQFIHYFNIQVDKDYGKQQIPKRVEDVFNAIKLAYKDKIDEETFTFYPGHLCSDLTWGPIMATYGEWASVKKGK